MSATLRVGVLLTASISVFACASGWCQSYPVKPVRLIIGGLPGTAPDVMARVIMPKVAESFGQSIINDNRGGGAGLLAIQLTPLPLLKDRHPVQKPPVGWQRHRLAEPLDPAE